MSSLLDSGVGIESGRRSSQDSRESASSSRGHDRVTGARNHEALTSPSPPGHSPVGRSVGKDERRRHQREVVGGGLYNSPRSGSRRYSSDSDSDSRKRHMDGSFNFGAGTISRLIDRFRNAPPTSREDRDGQENVAGTSNTRDKPPALTDSVESLARMEDEIVTSKSYAMEKPSEVDEDDFRNRKLVTRLLVSEMGISDDEDEDEDEEHMDDHQSPMNGDVNGVVAGDGEDTELESRTASALAKTEELLSTTVDEVDALEDSPNRSLLPELSDVSAGSPVVDTSVPRKQKSLLTEEMLRDPEEDILTRWRRSQALRQQQQGDNPKSDSQDVTSPRARVGLKVNTTRPAYSASAVPPRSPSSHSASSYPSPPQSPIHTPQGGDPSASADTASPASDGRSSPQGALSTLRRGWNWITRGGRNKPATPRSPVQRRPKTPTRDLRSRNAALAPHVESLISQTVSEFTRTSLFGDLSIAGGDREGSPALVMSSPITFDETAEKLLSPCKPSPARNIMPAFNASTMPAVKANKSPRPKPKPKPKPVDIDIVGGLSSFQSSRVHGAVPARTLSTPAGMSASHPVKRSAPIAIERMRSISSGSLPSTTPSPSKQTFAWSPNRAAYSSKDDWSDDSDDGVCNFDQSKNDAPTNPERGSGDSEQKESDTTTATTTLTVTEDDDTANRVSIDSDTMFSVSSQPASDDEHGSASGDEDGSSDDGTEYSSGEEEYERDEIFSILKRKAQFFRNEISKLVRSRTSSMASVGDAEEEAEDDRDADGESEDGDDHSEEEGDDSEVAVTDDAPNTIDGPIVS